MRINLTGTDVPLGTLKVGERIGQGGFGVVYEASLSGISARFAVKFLDPSPFTSDASKARARFFQEAEILLRLRHPHIIAVHGLGEHDGKPFILMERFNGVSLQRARDVGPPLPGSVLGFVEKIADALVHAHAQRVLHRDIKPTNLMTIRGDARVLDFGIAALMDPEGTRLTRTGGTQVGDSFSAPEILEDPRLLDPRSDVYSVGACWFWTLTGKTPNGVDWQSALRGVDGLSHDYERVVLRCMAQASKRYATMADLLADIRALTAERRPQLQANEIGDDDALVLGTIGAACKLPGDGVSRWEIERDVGGALLPLAMSVSLRKVLRLGLAELFEEREWNGPTARLLRLTSAGEEWIEQHQARVTDIFLVAQKLKDSAPTGRADDIPF